MADRNNSEVITGGCHCGALTYRFKSPLAAAELPVRPCSCTFCTKHGARYTSHPEGTVEVVVKEPYLLERYRFGHQTADFLICRRCGAIILAVCEIENRLCGVININTTDKPDCFVAQTVVSRFDAERREDRLARRSRNWIGHVSILTGETGL
ncbi:MAG: hypothetical protein ACE5EM_04010 [Sphingomonadales bacterium]